VYRFGFGDRPSSSRVSGVFFPSDVVLVAIRSGSLEPWPCCSSLLGAWPARAGNSFPGLARVVHAFTFQAMVSWRLVDHSDGLLQGS